MTFAILTIAYNEERFISHFIKHYSKVMPVSDIYVLVSTRPWNGIHTTSDNTALLAVDHGANVIQYPWSSETEQRNFGLKLLEHYDWVLTLDPDEYFLHGDLLKTFNALESTTSDIISTGLMYTYWKDGYRIDPPERHNPIVAMRPRARFRCNRGVSQAYSKLPETTPLHHFSWTRTDAEVWNKISHFAHSTEFDVKKWYEDKWLKWTPEMEDFHPISPRQYHRAIKTDIPEELIHITKGVS